MAKKKKVIKFNPPPVWNPKFYAHYNEDNGSIISISNEKLAMHTHSIEITFEDYEKFILGKNKILDYKIENGELFCTKVEQPKLKNKQIRLISSETDADITIFHWSKGWTFLLSDSARQRIYDKKIIGEGATIFLSSEPEHNFLIKVFNLPFKELVLDKIVIHFENKQENDISNLSLLTDSDLSFDIQVISNKEIHE